MLFFEVVALLAASLVSKSLTMLPSIISESMPAAVERASAEELAVIMLQAITGYKKQIRAHGIHLIHDISVGEETLLKHDSDIELAVVPVVLFYTTQKELSSSTDFYSIYVTLQQGDTITILIENLDLCNTPI